MNVLIINPPDKYTVVECPDENGRPFIEASDYGHFPPLGALYVLTHLEKNTEGHNLFFKDCVAEKISYEDLPAVIAEINPDVVGVTSFTTALVDVVKTARIIKEHNARTHTCLGGHHPTAFPYQAAQLPEFDSIVVGEGEHAFTALVNAIEAGENIEDIQGVYTHESIERWRGTRLNNKKYLHTDSPPPAYIKEINEIPRPNRKFIQHIRYNSIVGVKNNLATIITSRGCPYKCTFCDVPIKSYRERDVKDVIDEVEECLKLGYEEVHFYDDLFNIKPQRVKDICEEIMRRGLKFPWDFRGRVNCVDKESLAVAKKAGLRMVLFGVESGSDISLKNLRKGINTDKVRNAFRWCHELGIKTIANFMIGLPMEKSEEDVEEHLRFLYSLNSDFIQINILSLYPHTEVYRQAVAKGLVEPGRWEKWALNPTEGFIVDHWEEHIPFQRLLALQKSGYRNYYLRPANVFKQVVSTRSWYEFKVKARGVLQILNLYRLFLALYAWLRPAAVARGEQAKLPEM